MYFEVGRLPVQGESCHLTLEQEIMELGVWEGVLSPATYYNLLQTPSILWTTDNLCLGPLFNPPLKHIFSREERRERDRQKFFISNSYSCTSSCSLVLCLGKWTLSQPLSVPRCCWPQVYTYSTNQPLFTIRTFRLKFFKFWMFRTVHCKWNQNHFNYLLFQKLGITVHIVTYSISFWLDGDCWEPASRRCGGVHPFRQLWVAWQSGKMYYINHFNDFSYAIFSVVEPKSELQLFAERNRNRNVFRFRCRCAPLQTFGTY
jgi:hypothetical protein